MAITRLGLIGDNIRDSQAPRLHRLAGELCGIAVTYERLIPAELGKSFEAVFEGCRGYRGLNITLPYKERVLTKLADLNAATRAIGACNTVVFEPSGAQGFNTDHTGFLDAYRATFGPAAPGVVAIAGAGGVGKAIAFALAELGASTLRFFDLDVAKANALALALREVFALDAAVATSIAQAATGADGLVNCSTCGMVGYGGTAFPAEVLGGQSWAFDAVYTPRTTPFLLDARAAGLAVMGGYELFFHQGVNAFRIFTGCDVDPAALRRALRQSAAERWASA